MTIFDNGTDGNMAFLVMELLPGPTLQTYVAERGPLPEQDAGHTGGSRRFGDWSPPIVPA